LTLIAGANHKKLTKETIHLDIKPILNMFLKSLSCKPAKQCFPIEYVLSLQKIWWAAMHVHSTNNIVKSSEPREVLPDYLASHNVNKFSPSQSIYSLLKAIKKLGTDPLPIKQMSQSQPLTQWVKDVIAISGQ